MKVFKFRLETLLNLRELAKDRAVKDYSLAIANREKAEKNLQLAFDSLKSLNEEIYRKRKIGFSGFEQKDFNQSILQAKDLIVDLNSDLEQAKSIEDAKRNIFIKADSSYKSLSKLKGKSRILHLKKEEKREESELEDIISSRFVYNQSSH